MKRYTTDEYNEIFSKLPQEVRDVLASMTTVETILAIGEKRKLHVDQIDKLREVAFDVMMGITASKDMTNEVAKECGISQIEASVLVRDVDTEIFKPIKEIMMHMYGEGAPFAKKEGFKQSTTVGTKTSTDEEDHSNLDKESILNEIENPPEAKVKVVITEPIAEAGIQAPEQSPNQAPQSKSETVIPSTTEVSPKALEKSAETPSKPDISALRENILKNITETKLSGVVTMPKEQTIAIQQVASAQTLTPQPSIKQNEEKIEPEASFSPEPSKTESPTVPKTEIAIPNADASKETTPPGNNYPGIDPYREPIE